MTTPDDVYGDYRVLDELGHGAMGRVYRAHDPRLGRDVALKLVLPPGTEKEASRARARLVAEARALARLSHPNVLAVYDVGERDDVVFVALELVDGVDLAHWLRARKRPWREVVRVFIDVASGLAAVHHAGLVHRDVKPANILIEHAVPGRASERVLLADFGIARVTTAAESITLPGDGEGSISGSVDATPLTDAGHVAGTPAYMAPEQHLGQDVGPAADQYALCVALHEALYRKRPFIDDPRAIFHFKLTPPDRPPPDSDVPAWLWRVVRRGLSPKPPDRFASIDDLRDALQVGPRARRRTITAVASATLLVGAMIAWTLTRPSRCEGPASRLADVWNDERDATIAAAFAASERPQAAQTWADVASQFDTYTQDLAAMYREACEATYERHEQSEDLFDRRVLCLDRCRHGLEQSLALLAAGDPDLVDRADDVVSSLASIDACADVAALEAGIVPPSPAQREAVAQVDRVLADAEALYAAGRYDDAASTVEAAVDLARTIDYPPTIVRALTLSAELHERQSRIDEARIALDEAIESGLGIGADSVVVRAIVMRTWIAAEYERDLPAAERWAALGRSLLKRVGDPRVPAVGLHNALGTAYAAAGRHTEALREYTDALAQVEGDSELTAWAATLHANIGSVQYRLGDLELARASYESARESFRALGGDDHPSVVNTSVRIAKIQAQSGRYREAIAGLRDAIASLERMQATPTELATALIALGLALRGVGEDDESNTTYRRAVELLENTGDDVSLGHALVSYGSSCVDRGIYDAAETQLQRAVALLEPIDPAGQDLGSAWLGLGRIREHQSKPDDALSFYRRALDAAPVGTRQAARALVAIARVHHRAGRYDEATAALDRQDAILAAAPLVLLDDRIAAAIVRVDVLVDAGRATDSAEPIDTLDRLLTEARSGGGTLRSAEGELALGRARLARDASAGLDSSVGR